MNAGTTPIAYFFADTRKMTNSTTNEATVLITGGTGTFGEAMIERLLREPVREIRILSRDEKKQDDLRRTFADSRLKWFVGDVRNQSSLQRAADGASLVFHAAALKQVPSCEFHPLEAVQTNTLGADNVISVCIANRVRCAVFLSTDKAVYPINAMGLSKALMEKIVISRAEHAATHGTTLCITRYGNVIGSRGSIVPLLIHRILRGEPVTITEPTMTRFIMSVDEAIELVIRAYDSARPGDTWVRQSSAAILSDIFAATELLVGKKAERKTIGTRHGEKLFETLLTREEMSRAEPEGGYFRIPHDTRDLNYALYFTEGESKVARTDDYNSENAPRLSPDQILEYLRTDKIIIRALSGV